MSGVPHSLFDTIRRIVQEEMQTLRTAELGIVQEVHPHEDDSDSDNYACTVSLPTSNIVLAKVPIATQQIGSVSVPAIGEMVLLQFIGGDINAPIITGRLYNNEDRPPVNKLMQSVMHYPADGSAVHLEINSGDTHDIKLKLGDVLEINLKNDDPVVEINVDDGSGVISISRDGSIVLDSQADISIKGGASVNIEAATDLNLSGATINLN